MQSTAETYVILGTGGTIAGTSSSPQDHLGYTAAQRSIQDLVAAVPALYDYWLDVEQVAQIDSKDMTHATWQQLAQRVAHHLDRTSVGGVVITHGTDTLEETAWFLQRVLAPTKPVVLTAAMRPATSDEADGPQNMADAMRVASEVGATGVLVVMAGQVHAAADVRKRHTVRIDAFDSGEAGPVGLVAGADVRLVREWPTGVAVAVGIDRIARPPLAWPRVDILTSHAGADGEIVKAMVNAGARGIVVAGTGNGSVHASLLGALQEARAAGVRVLRSTRCAEGEVMNAEGDAAGDVESLPSAGRLSPAQARIELLLELLGEAPPAV